MSSIRGGKSFAERFYTAKVYNRFRFQAIQISRMIKKADWSGRLLRSCRK